MCISMLSLGFPLSPISLSILISIAHSHDGDEPMQRSHFCRPVGYEMLVCTTPEYRSASQLLKLGDDKGNRLRLWMWTNSLLIDCSSPDVGSLGTSSVNALDGDGDVVDQLRSSRMRPRFRLSSLNSTESMPSRSRRPLNCVEDFGAASKGSRRTSLSQTRTTVQPSARSRRVTCRSRWRFRSIFATQYDAFQPSASLPFLFDHLRPCQKSPSQKTTTRCLAIAKSGRPINAGGCEAIPNAGGPKSLSQEDLRSGILTTIASPNAARL